MIVVRDWLELGKIQPAKIIMALLAAPARTLPWTALAQAIRPRQRDMGCSHGVVRVTAHYARDALADVGCPAAIFSEAGVYVLTAEAALRIEQLLDSRRVSG